MSNKRDKVRLWWRDVLAVTAGPVAGYCLGYAVRTEGAAGYIYYLMYSVLLSSIISVLARRAAVLGSILGVSGIFAAYIVQEYSWDKVHNYHFTVAIFISNFVTTGFLTWFLALGIAVGISIPLHDSKPK